MTDANTAQKLDQIETRERRRNVGRKWRCAMLVIVMAAARLIP